MTEPQPPSVHEGSSTDPANPDTLPTNAEDRKAAAALNALDTRQGEEESQSGGDSEAMRKAMKNLDVKDTKKGGSASGVVGTAAATAPAKKVKIETGDVTLLVDQLELSKVKATELLRAHEGDAVKAMTAYITAPV